MSPASTFISACVIWQPPGPFRRAAVLGTSPPHGSASSADGKPPRNARQEKYTDNSTCEKVRTPSGRRGRKGSASRLLLHGPRQRILRPPEQVLHKRSAGTPRAVAGEHVVGLQRQHLP